LAEACRSVVSAHRFLHLARNALVRHFHEIKPILARKLARMDLQQFQELYLRAKEEKRKG
jgi:hypothetical protein